MIQKPTYLDFWLAPDVKFMKTTLVVNALSSVDHTQCDAVVMPLKLFEPVISNKLFQKFVHTV